MIRISAWPPRGPGYRMTVGAGNACRFRGGVLMTGAGGPVAGAADADLVRRTRQGDLDAYAVLADRHGPMAYRVALRLLGNRQDAEDIVQEALVAAWRQLPGFRAEASFGTWLYQIVTRRALNHHSRARAARALDDLPGDGVSAAAGPAGEAERGLTADAVTAAVAALPPPQRVAVVLHHFEGPAQHRDRPHHRQHRPGHPRPPAAGQAHAGHDARGLEMSPQCPVRATRKTPGLLAGGGDSAARRCAQKPFRKMAAKIMCDICCWAVSN